MQHKNDVTVLLVDDDEIDVMGVKRAFTQSDLKNKIVVASDGRQALDILRDGSSVNRPYMMLLDLNMPRMNGIELLENMRSDPALKDAIVFVLTTSRAREDRQKAYDHNVAGYIVKGEVREGYLDAVGLLKHYSDVVQFP